MLWLFVVMFILFVINVPIGWSMAIAATVFMAFGPHVPLQGMVQRMIGGIDTFPLLAIPFFILAGNLMKHRRDHRSAGSGRKGYGGSHHRGIGPRGGGDQHDHGRDVRFWRGGCCRQWHDSHPGHEKAGYTVPFSAAIVGAASTIGPIIPPSIPFVIYGSIAGVSVGRLLLGGAVPGVLMGSC